MASTLTTGGAVALNDKVSYWVNSFDAGDNPRNEFWLKPMALGAKPILGGYVDDVAYVTINLRVLGTTVANLQTKLNTVRNEFVTQGVNAAAVALGGDNTITWTPSGGTAKTIVTYASKIPAVNLSTEFGGTKYLAIAATQFTVLNWQIVIARQPYYSEDASGFRTPAI